MTIAELNRSEFKARWDRLNARLESVRVQLGLSAAFDELVLQQRDSAWGAAGEIHESRAGRFHVQRNLSRKSRFLAMAGGCPLCTEPESMWQRHHGIQLGFDLEFLNASYVALVNPYAIMTGGHLTVTTRNHVPQALFETSGDLVSFLSDFITLAAALSSYSVIWNGCKSGVSIPHHRHDQVVKRAVPLPLELIARGCAAGLSTSDVLEGVVIADTDYPLTAIYVRGTAGSHLVASVADWIERWLAFSNTRELSANLIGTRLEATDEVELFFIPRSSAHERGSGMSGALGSLECMGLLVLSDEHDVIASESEAVQCLAGVKPPRVDEFTTQAARGRSAANAQGIGWRAAVPRPDSVCHTGRTSPPLKSIIAAGGHGGRSGAGELKPLVPIHDKASVFYWIEPHLKMGVRDIHIVCSPANRTMLESRVGDGAAFGVHVTYSVVADPDGPAGILRRPEIRSFIGGDRVCLSLDGVYFDGNVDSTLRDAANSPGCTILAKFVEDPRNVGSILLDGARVVGFKEEDRSLLPVAGVRYLVPCHTFVYPPGICDEALKLTRSTRGDEYDLVDLHEAYRRAGLLSVLLLRGGTWVDAGTPAGLSTLTSLVASAQSTGRPVGSPHWTAYRAGLTSGAQLRTYAESLGLSDPYGQLLLDALVGETFRGI